MHKISKAIIKNFRSCEDNEITLADYTPIVGYNNAGKSNIIRALEWAIEPRALVESDFFNSSSAVIVECHVDGVTEAVLEKLGSHRPKIEPHVINNSIRIRTIQNMPGGSNKDVKREIWIDSDQKWGNPQGIPNAIIALFPDVIRIEAMIDVNAELSSNKTTTTIGKLIKAVMDPIVSEQGTAIKKVLDELRSLFGADGSARAESLNSFDTMATEAIQEFFPGVSARLDAPPPEIKEIFKSGKLVFSESGSGTATWRDVQYYGHGVLRAAQMAMVKMLAKVATSNEGGRTLLLIDEPELYMHPQMIASIRCALSKISKTGFQVVFSTHSPLMIDRASTVDTLIVSKPLGVTQIKRTLRSCCHEILGCDGQISSLMLDLNNASNFLFCDNVLFVEGSTEREILPDIIELITGNSVLQSKTALITLNGCDGLPNARRLLNSVDMKHKAIADLDFAFRHGSTLQIWDRDTDLYKRALSEFSSIAQNGTFQIGENGLFEKCNGRTAEEAYHHFAKSEQCAQLVDDIITLFKYHNIWLWRLGSIEYHLGMPNKGGAAIRNFKKQLQTRPIADVVHDYSGIESAVQWALNH